MIVVAMKERTPLPVPVWTPLDCSLIVTVKNTTKKDKKKDKKRLTARE